MTENVVNALTAPVEALIDQSIRASVEESLTDLLTAVDAEILAIWGIPLSEHLPFELVGDTGPDFYGRWYKIGRLGNKDLVVTQKTGAVLMVDEELGVPRGFVNSSLRQFSETAWRFHSLAPHLISLVEAGENHFNDLEMFWECAQRIDHRIDLDPSISYWQGKSEDI